MIFTNPPQDTPAAAANSSSMPSTQHHRFSPYPVKPPAEHPHCLQACPPVHATVFHYILQHGSFPREKYVPHDKREHTSSVLHRGQRKLLMSEIGALIRLDPAKQYTAVYAGAAPGIHIPLLSKLFPNLVFHLYDPAPFRIKETERIKLFNACFTDETAQSYTPTTPRRARYQSLDANARSDPGRRSRQARCPGFRGLGPGSRRGGS